MVTPLTFGVEFEMAVVDGFDSGREFHTDKRIINFSEDTTPQDDDMSDVSPEPYEAWATEEEWKPVARHMAQTLRAAGFKATVHKEDNGTWDFTRDISIGEPEEEDPDSLVRYTYVGIELRSPALYFTPESLQAVADVLKLLKRTYMINTNSTTGLHVHVGDGKKGWQFSTIQKLFAFVWSFEHQLSTLFPPSRVDGDFTHSMRNSANYVNIFVGDKSRRPKPMEGLVRILKCESFDILSLLFMCGTFRMAPNAKTRDGRDNRKPTVEWRHHEGTMDEVSVCMWIKTVVGIMDFLRNVEPGVFTKLLSILEHEHWQKVGDGKDGQREREMGPILAESGFTIIDLLEIMGLYEPAKFYKERGLYRIEVDATRQNTQPATYYWRNGPALATGMQQPDILEEDPASGTLVGSWEVIEDIDNAEEAMAVEVSIQDVEW